MYSSFPELSLLSLIPVTYTHLREDWEAKWSKGMEIRKRRKKILLHWRCQQRFIIIFFTIQTLQTFKNIPQSELKPRIYTKEIEKRQITKLEIAGTLYHYISLRLKPFISTPVINKYFTNEWKVKWSKVMKIVKRKWYCELEILTKIYCYSTPRPRHLLCFLRSASVIKGNRRSHDAKNSNQQSK